MNTELEPEPARAAGARLAAEAAAAHARIGSLVAQIRGANGGRPWGGDSAGQTFESGYEVSSETLDATEVVVPAIEDMGDLVVQAVDETVAEDQAVARMIYGVQTSDVADLDLPDEWVGGYHGANRGH